MKKFESEKLTFEKFKVLLGGVVTILEAYILIHHTTFHFIITFIIILFIEKKCKKMENKPENRDIYNSEGDVTRRDVRDALTTPPPHVKK